MVSEVNLPYYKNLIQNITADLLQSKERIENLTQSEKLLLPEDKERLLQQYLKKAVIILGENTK